MRSFFVVLILTLATVSLAQEKAATTPAKADDAKPDAVADKDITPDIAADFQGTLEQPVATLTTSAGTFRCVLFKKEAPMTVENFIGLANGSKDWTDPATSNKRHHVSLYNGTIFHRVIPGFMIQGGDPMGTGNGDPGYSFKDEFSDDLLFDRPGRLAMANSGPNTNGSQFFITEVPTPHLDGKHTIFGQCDNVSLVQQIAREPRNQSNDRPVDPVRIEKITFDGVRPPPRPVVHHPAKPASSSKPKSH
ncbi:MAG TPA: peptidylprolyl isomerase [Candidatus Koribacter sp.]|jgi:cyclophilin family peptidyl-prolyl cis-trans isomerase